MRARWDSLTDDDLRKAVTVAEKYADGLWGDYSLESQHSKLSRARPWINSSFFQACHDLLLPDPLTALRGCLRGYSLNGHEGEYFQDIFGNPFRPVAFAPAWRTDTAVSLARGMYEARDFGAMPILADALQDAGCDSDDILNHCRDPNQVHVRGCWVVDLVLGKS